MPRVFPERSDSLRWFAVQWFTRPNSCFKRRLLILNIKAIHLGSTLASFTEPLLSHSREEKRAYSNLKRRAIVTGMLPRVVATVSLASLCVLALVLTFTSPSTTGPFGLLLLFISAYLTFVGLISFFLFGINRLIVMVTSGMTVRKPIRPMEFRRAYYFSTVLAAAPVMLIGLQSVQSAGGYEVILVIIFEIIACVYISRRMR